MQSERDKNSDSSSNDQWHVVSKETLRDQMRFHQWRMVTLRNQAGKLSPGLQCDDCGAIERLTQSQIRSHGNQTHRPER
jgi:hypothetical protein